ncbi:MAG: flagellar biosynthesis protein FlgC [Spirochaetes bacterium DG_61]|jgi:flagellar basal-body rod protein FlgF|nr:MAG: flagellar biosynthesis protein FlgC [Spirochaetes bacterium DG_61]
MVRGIYTGASGMIAEMRRIDVISNNLANVDTPSYKKDISIMKAFPEMLIRRINDDGVRVLPIGSYDLMPVIGKMGTGVEVNEVYTRHIQGAFKQTENEFDLALEGEGFFCVETEEGERYTRNGSFLIDRDGFLVTKDGYRILGENGPIQIKKNNFIVDEDGNIFENREFMEDPLRLVSMEENEWNETVLVDRLRIVNFPKLRYVKKIGESLYRETEYSERPFIVENERPKVRQGFLEASNVNPVTEMVNLIEVHRTYEANQRMIQSHDTMLAKAVNEVGKA